MKPKLGAFPARFSNTVGWGGSKSDFRWTISEAYHPTLISGIVPNYPLNRPFGSISDCSLFSIERSAFTWLHSQSRLTCNFSRHFRPGSTLPRKKWQRVLVQVAWNTIVCSVSLSLSPLSSLRFSKSSLLDNIFNPFDWTKFGTTLETP